VSVSIHVPVPEQRLIIPDPSDESLSSESCLSVSDLVVWPGQAPGVHVAGSEGAGVVEISFDPSSISTKFVRDVVLGLRLGLGVEPHVSENQDRRFVVKVGGSCAVYRGGHAPLILGDVLSALKAHGVYRP